jgi:hypothetical protein
MATEQNRPITVEVVDITKICLLLRPPDADHTHTHTRTHTRHLKLKYGIDTQNNLQLNRKEHRSHVGQTVRLERRRVFLCSSVGMFYEFTRVIRNVCA